MRCFRLHVVYVVLPVFLLWQVFLIHLDFGTAIGGSVKGELQGTTKYTSYSTLETRDVWKSDPSGFEPQENSSHQRRLTQELTSEAGGDVDVFTCSLNESVLAALYDADKGRWLVDDNTFSTLDGNIQSIINCTAEHDVIMFKTRSILKPQSTLTIPWNLTLSGYYDGNGVRRGIVAKADKKVGFTCPANGPLIVARTPSFVVANVMINGCNTTFDIILLAQNCTKNQNLSQAQLVHVDFNNNSLANNGSLINGLGAVCTQVSLEDVEFNRNSCDGKGCVLLSSNCTIRNIRLMQNRRKNRSSNDCSMFSVQEGSQVYVKNMSVVRNEIRVFHVNRSSITIRESSFEGNKEERDSIPPSKAYKGGVLFAKQSIVSVQDSTYAHLVTSSGGAIYATFSKINIENCSFTKNTATTGRGGAVFVNSGPLCNLTSITFANNFAKEGGAIHVTRVSTKLKDCQFIQNNALFGGACLFRDGYTVHMERATFYANRAEAYWGGAIAIVAKTTIRIKDSLFHHNNASRNGGAIDASEDCQVHFKNVTSTNNTAGSNGGSIRVHTRTKVVIVNSDFLGNQAQYGGAMYARLNSNLKILNSSLTSNRAESGGCISVELNSNMTVVDSILQRNIATRKGGAISLRSNSTSAVYNVSVLNNKSGMDCGGIYLFHHSFFNATWMSVKMNEANDIAGGIGLFSNSSLLCYSCLFEMNTALDGAGMYVRSENKMQSIDAQLQNCRFVNNSATLSGGGLMFEGPHNKHQNCSKESRVCGSVVLLNTSFVDNFAKQLGSAILATNVQDVLVGCHYDGGILYDFLHQTYLRFLSHMSPKRTCKSWMGNRLETPRMEGIVGTFGKELSLSMNSTKSSRGVRLVVDEEEGIILENVRSGKRLPEINVVIIDAFGNRDAPTIPRSLSIAITSPDKFFRGEFRVKTRLGRGSFSDIVGFKPPGYYTIKITPQISTISQLIMKISIPDCDIGEEPTNGGELCQKCDEFSYNFDVNNSKGCTHCPEGSTCEGRYIIPKDGYWHKGPCHNRTQKCIVKAACTNKTRHEDLVDFDESFMDCNLNTTTLETYNDLQCKKGYKGCLCGSCNKSYGVSGNLECVKCGHYFFSILRLFGTILYLLIVATATIKGTLPIASRQYTQQRATAIELMHITTTSIEGETNIQEDAPLLQGSDAHQVATSREATLSRASTQQAIDVRSSQRNVVETWKILLNFFQVTSTAVTMNVKWTKKILGFLQTLNLLGVAAINSISRPTDCLIASSSNATRVISRYLFSIFMPTIVIVMLSIYWGLRSIAMHGGDTLYSLKRFILTLITVTYITYFDITKLAVRVFNCLVVYDDESPFSNSFSRYWIADTSIECYKSTHVVLMIISIVILVLVSVSFPLACSWALLKTRNEVQTNNSWANETLGLLCGPFKTRFIYWECMTMMKKGILSIIVVFSYSLGNQAQGLLMILVIVFFLSLHSTCYPFREEFSSLNYYEIGSLLTSCATYTLVQFFNVETLSDNTRSVVSLSLIVLNGTFVTFMVFLIARNLIRLARAVLLSRNVAIPVGTGWFSVLKLYMQNGDHNTTSP